MMPRRAIGDRPLTPAERQAHQREKHKREQDRQRDLLVRARNALVVRSLDTRQLIDEINDALAAYAVR